MGLFTKLKNVLFEEEEIEVSEEPKKEPKVLERKKNVYEEEVKDDTPIISDKELFKAEKTFDFPVFDDKEFEDLKIKEEEPKSMGINLFDYDKPKIKRETTKTKTPEIKGRAYDTKKNDTQKFHPSPVISPVYGVLDKNYKKEDIIVAKDAKKKIDVDDVRKRAFGTLEEDLEKSLIETPKKKEEETKIDELLESASTDKIELPKEITEDTLDLEVLDKNEIKTEEEQIENSDTLENDLFDLIDSMYEDKEEE